MGEEVKERRKLCNFAKQNLGKWKADKAAWVVEKKDLVERLE